MTAPSETGDPSSKPDRPAGHGKIPWLLVLSLIVIVITIVLIINELSPQP